VAENATKTEAETSDPPRDEVEAAAPEPTPAPAPEPAVHVRLKALPAAGLAVLSGVLYWAAFPGIDVWPLAFICWAPLLVAIYDQPPRRALWLGLLQGLTCNMIGFYWLFGMLKTFSGFPDPLCALFMVLLCGYQGGRMAFMSWLYGRAARKGWPAATVFLLALAASEQAYPLLFPWFTGAQTHTVPMLMQLADLGGPIAIGLALAGGSLALAEPFWARLDRRPIDRRRVGLALIGPAFLVIYGAIRLPMVDKAMANATPAKVGVVQGNMGLMGSEHRDPRPIHREASLRLEAEAHPDLIVWSEAAIAYPFPESSIEHLVRDTVLHDPRTGTGLTTPVLTGLIVDRSPPRFPGQPRKKGERPLYFNSAVLAEPDGKIEGVYDKTYLLAFGEYIPFGDWFPQLYEMSPNSGQLTKGSSLAPIPFGPHKITTLICYEDILPGFVNGAVRAGDPDLIVNLTNDAWFGTSTEPAIHLALAKYRAVEHHRYLVRATNTGVSAWIDAAGRSRGETKLFQLVAQSGEIRWMRGKTVYEIVGDVPWWAATLVVFAMGFVERRKVFAPKAA
jgi:apolipoprotein N-acyltransferase